MRAEYHAQRRFSLRVNSVVNAEEGVTEMWEGGREATDEDLSLFWAKRMPNNQYRIGRFMNGPAYLLVARGHCIVTVIEQPNRR